LHQSVGSDLLIKTGCQTEIWCYSDAGATGVSRSVVREAVRVLDRAAPLA
jgi:hypothetical protein